MSGKGGTGRDGLFTQRMKQYGCVLAWLCSSRLQHIKSLYYFESLARHLKVASFLVVLQVVRIVVLWVCAVIAAKELPLPQCVGILS